MCISYKQLLLGELVASEVLQAVLELRSRVRTPGVSLGGRLLADRRVGRVHQLPLYSPWALG